MADNLDQMLSRMESGESLGVADIDSLVSTGDLLGLGALADLSRRRLHDDRVTFVRVAMVSAESEVAPVLGDIPLTASEVRIVGEPHTPEIAAEVTRQVVSGVSDIPVTGFRLDQLAQVCSNDAKVLASLLSELRRVGLDMVSEARIETSEISEWLEVADEVGLDVATLTIGEFCVTDRVDLIRRAAALRPGIANVRAFNPLPRLGETRASTGYADTRQVALARLLVDNISSIQVDWDRYGPKLAQVALTFGADDVDAVSPVDSTDQGVRRTALEEITRNIQAASLSPVQRNGRFET